MQRFPCACCGAPITRHTLRKYQGHCADCRPGPRVLEGAERDASIAEFMAWLDGRMPSEVLRAMPRPQTMLEMAFG